MFLLQRFLYCTVVYCLYLCGQSNCDDYGLNKIIKNLPWLLGCDCYRSSYWIYFTPCRQSFGE